MRQQQHRCAVLVKMLQYYSPNPACGYSGCLHEGESLHEEVFSATDLRNKFDPLHLQYDLINNQNSVLERDSNLHRQWCWWRKGAQLNRSVWCLLSEIHVSPGQISVLRSGPFYKAEALDMLISQSKAFLLSANSYSAELIMQVRCIAVLLLCNTADLYAPCAQCLKYKQIYAALILSVVISVI